MCCKKQAAAFLTDLVMSRPLSQQLSIVDSLSSRQDLLSTHEHVVRVGIFLVDGGKKKKVVRQLISKDT